MKYENRQVPSYVNKRFDLCIRTGKYKFYVQYFHSATVTSAYSHVRTFFLCFVLPKTFCFWNNKFDDSERFAIRCGLSYRLREHSWWFQGDTFFFFHNLSLGYAIVIFADKQNVVFERDLTFWAQVKVAKSENKIEKEDSDYISNRAFECSPWLMTFKRKRNSKQNDITQNKWRSKTKDERNKNYQPNLFFEFCVFWSLQQRT